MILVIATPTKGCMNRKLKKKPSMPALKAIRDCGGPEATAALCGVSVQAVYAWRGSVPARHQEKIKAYVASLKK